MAVLVGAMIPLRGHLDIAIVALLLVVPVVLGAAIGGFLPGAIASVVGFIAYDLFFIPPYGTLTVGHLVDWAALGVYVVVMLLVSRVVDRLWQAEAASSESQRNTAHLLELSELLVGDRSQEELFQIVVRSVREAFDLSAVVLLLPASSKDGSQGSAPLELVAGTGRELEPAELASLVPTGGAPWSLRPEAVRRQVGDASLVEPAEELETVVLKVRENTVGLLGIAGKRLLPARRELLGAFANHIALAIERANLHEQALRVQLLEEVDRHRRYLFGAVSHDLRTPLATIKTSASALLDSSIVLGDDDRRELASLIEAQSDRLARVVSNLLDMSRIQVGALVLDVETISVEELFATVLQAAGPSRARIFTAIRLVDAFLQVDVTLLVEALLNLLENAIRYAPEETLVELIAEPGDPSAATIRLLVVDRGPGIAQADRSRYLSYTGQDLSASRPASGGSGLGLPIAKAFVEAHGAKIFIEDAAPGTRVVIEIPSGAITSGAAAELSESL